MACDPDLLLVNANVLTMDQDRPTAGAVAVADGRIVGVYDGHPDLTAAEVIDLRGLTLIPGFHDAHNHMIGFGLSLTEVDLRVVGLDELYARVAAKAASTPEGEWIIGSGYDQHRTGAHPDRDRLDAIAPNHRVWLKHTSSHMCVVNSLVLADLGLAKAGRPVDGGRVATDAAGRPTGLLEERAQELVGDLTRPYPLTTLAEAVDAAGRRYLAEGITSVTEAGVGGGWIGQSPVELAAYVAARDRARLHVRVELMVVSDAFHPLGAHPSDGIETGIDLGLRTGFGDDWLRLGPMKIFTDGSLVGRTAAMSAPFAGEPGNSGYLQADADHLTEMIIAAHRAGWRVAAHAIGDRAIDLALDAFADAADQYPRPRPRHRIEHFAVARPDQVARAAKLGVIAVGQGRFASELGDGMLAAVGPARAGWLYRQRSLLDAGLVLPGSSDRPVASGAPLLGIHDMVNRRTASGAPFNQAEAVTAAEALRAYTWGSAYASKQERTKGSVAPGKLADFTVLSEDPTAVAPDRIAGLEVVATFLDGTLRHTAPGAFPG
ncbi:MAG TPA: amidohydrolase [Trebonia sp.]|nr:amidohydrolase [Trebonia sp.]